VWHDEPRSRGVPHLRSDSLSTSEVGRYRGTSLLLSTLPLGPPSGSSGSGTPRGSRLPIPQPSGPTWNRAGNSDAKLHPNRFPAPALATNLIRAEQGTGGHRVLASRQRRVTPLGRRAAPFLSWRRPTFFVPLLSHNSPGNPNLKEGCTIAPRITRRVNVADMQSRLLLVSAAVLRASDGYRPPPGRPGAFRPV